jgi:hypothetical protein
MLLQKKGVTVLLDVRLNAISRAGDRGTGSARASQ